MPRISQAAIDAPAKLWLTATEAARWLSMNRRVFLRYVDLGIFPRGRQRQGEKWARWSRTDVAVCQYLLANDERFGWFRLAEEERAKEAEIAARLDAEKATKKSEKVREKE